MLQSTENYTLVNKKIYSRSYFGLILAFLNLQIKNQGSTKYITF